MKLILLLTVFAVSAIALPLEGKRSDMEVREEAEAAAPAPAPAAGEVTTVDEISEALYGGWGPYYYGGY